MTYYFFCAVDVLVFVFRLDRLTLMHVVALIVLVSTTIMFLLYFLRFKI
jgi:hypothetical protein